MISQISLSAIPTCINWIAGFKQIAATSRTGFSQLSLAPTLCFGPPGICFVSWLVVYLPLWKIWKSVGIIIPNIWKNKKCSKPPTSVIIFNPTPDEGWRINPFIEGSGTCRRWKTNGLWINKSNPRNGVEMEMDTGSTPMNHHSSNDQNPPVIPFNPGWFIRIPRSWIIISTFSWVYHPRTSQPHLHVQVQAVEPCWSLGQVKVPGDGTYGKILWLMVLLGTSSIIKSSLVGGFNPSEKY